MSQFILTGTVRSDKKNIIGYRILNKTNHQGTTVPTDKIADMIKSHGVEGLSIEGGKITGTNGAIDRYPIIDTKGRLVENNSIIVLGMNGDTFLCSDYNGTVLKMKEQEAISFASKKGNNIANGKIVTRGNKQIISAINGTYNTIDIPKKKEEKKKKPIDQMSQEEAVKDIQKALVMVVKEVIKRGYGVRDYDAVGAAMKETKIVFTSQLEDEANLDKVCKIAIKLFLQNEE